jgi:hypothetical protein
VERIDAGAEQVASAGRANSGAAAANSTRSNDQAAGADESIGTIVALRETTPDKYLITLDNGQVWRQVATKRYRLQTGMDVRIYPGWGNSLRLTAVDANGFIQVERAR